ncbi:hypothetical protein B0H13DRAFT_2036494, partial [Mycena leptocephala]
MHAGGDWLVRRRGRALVLIWVGVGMISLWIWIWVGSMRAFGLLWGTAAEDVFVGGVAFGAGLAGAQRSIHPRGDETRRR